MCISIYLSKRIPNRASVCFTVYTAAAVCLALIGFLWYNSLCSGTLRYCQTTKNLPLAAGGCLRMCGLTLKQLIKKLDLIHSH